MDYTCYTLKIKSDGKLRSSSIYLMADGKELFELFCRSFAVKTDAHNRTGAAMRVSVPLNMKPSHRAILFSLMVEPPETLPSGGEIRLHLPISEMSMNWRV